jgi:hypothetical protein
MHLLSAYKAVGSERWKYPLEQALDLSLRNVPQLGGNTAIFVDVSGSMQNRLSTRSDLMRWEAAAIFGAALALRAEHADLFIYSYNLGQIEFERGSSVFQILNTVRQHGGGRNEHLGSIVAGVRRPRSRHRPHRRADQRRSWYGGTSTPARR